MKTLRFLSILLLAITCGCSSSTDSNRVVDEVQGNAPEDGGSRFPLQCGNYTVLGILTDNQDNNKAKENVESTVLRHDDIACMVGLWSANTPMILAGLRSSDRLGKIAVVGFDEHEDTLAGIRQGHVHGTVVQNPYAFGYRSVQWLTQIAKDQPIDVPESGLLYIPHQEITKDNVQSFTDQVAAMRAGDGPMLAKDLVLDGQGVTVGLITNSTDPFWGLAEKGCEKAAQQFGCLADVQMPSQGTIEEQKRFLESNAAGGFSGVAISPIDPENQTGMINEACESMNVICQDSDAPTSKRKFYLGTSNYMAGRSAGKLIKQVIPDGGKVMLFVGKMEVLNAQERSQGIIDELSDAPVPEIFQ